MCPSWSVLWKKLCLKEVLGLSLPGQLPTLWSNSGTFPYEETPEPFLVHHAPDIILQNLQDDGGRGGQGLQVFPTNSSLQVSLLKPNVSLIEQI